jgi:hypothetical protein
MFPAHPGIPVIKTSNSIISLFIASVISHEDTKNNTQLNLMTENASKKFGKKETTTN